MTVPRIHLPEDQALLLCTRQDFNNEHSQALHLLSQKAFDWKWLLKTAVDNNIAPLIFTNLKNAGVELPPEVEVSFKKEHINNILRKKETRKLLHQVLVCVSNWRMEHNIPIRTMLVKGTAFGILIYDKPWYTRSGDIDLIFDLPASQVPGEARKHLIDRLFILSKSPDQFRPILEYDFYIHHDININGLLPINADRIWQNAETIQLEGIGTLVMSPEDSLISAAVACFRRRYFFLKSLLDISECTRHLPNLNWQRVVEIARSDKVDAIVFTGLWLAKQCLDAQTPAWVFKELQVSALQKKIIQLLASYLLAHFSFEHLTRVSNIDDHPLSAALLLTYLSLKPSQSIRKMTRDLKGILHG